MCTLNTSQSREEHVSLCWNQWLLWLPLPVLVGLADFQTPCQCHSSDGHFYSGSSPSSFSGAFYSDNSLASLMCRNLPLGCDERSYQYSELWKSGEAFSEGVPERSVGLEALTTHFKKLLFMWIQIYTKDASGVAVPLFREIPHTTKNSPEDFFFKQTLMPFKLNWILKIQFVAVVSHGAKCPTSDLFSSFDGKQITDDISGWSTFPRSPERPGEPVVVHGESFYSGDKEESHNEDSQALTPPWWYLSSFWTLNSPGGDDGQCGVQQRMAGILLLIQSESDIFRLSCSCLKDFCESAKLLPSLQIIIIKCLLLCLP